MGAARLSMALCLKLESSVSTSAMCRLFSCIWPSPVNSTATAVTLGLCKAKPTGTPGRERFSQTKLLHTTKNSKVTLDPFTLFGQCQSCSCIVLSSRALKTQSTEHLHVAVSCTTSFLHSMNFKGGLRICAACSNPQCLLVVPT